MKLLRKRDIPDEKYSNAFLGFGPEESQFVVELTYSMFKLYQLKTRYSLFSSYRYLDVIIPCFSVFNLKYCSSFINMLFSYFNVILRAMTMHKFFVVQV